MDIFGYICTTIGAGTLAVWVMRFVDWLERPRKRASPHKEEKSQ